MPQIIPIKDLKNTSEISDMCHRAEEPIYITAMYRDIEISEKQIEAGQVKDARTALRETRAKYGL